MRIFLARLARIITFPYYFVRNTYPVWFGILNKEGRDLFQKNQPKLSPVATRVVTDLKREGIAITHINELIPGVDFSKLESYLHTLKRPKDKTRVKTYLVPLFEPKMAISLENPFVRLALMPHITGIVNSYMEMFSKFVWFSLDVTMPMPAGSEPIRSQRWHRDHGDKKMCKMFLYLTDVDENAGPFTYIRQTQYGGKWRTVFPIRPPRGVYPPEGAVEAKIPNEYVKVCTGKPGTIIFCDTSGLHKGGYAKSKERIMFTAGFWSSAALRQADYAVPRGFKEKAKELDLPARFAVDHPESK